jgi:hypothetical protein
MPHMPSNRFSTSLLALTAAVTLAACGSGAVSESGPATATGTATGTASPAPASTPLPAPAPKKLAESKYGVFFHYLNDAGPDTPPKPGGIDNGVWDATVKSFNLDNFVLDVKATGADYVIFTIGQTARNFASPNTVLEAAAAAAYGDSKLNRPGAFTATRDLVGEMAERLTKEGIAFYPYYPSSSWFDYAPTGPTTNTGWNTPAILTEYAKRWRNNVSGWWIDGCYPTLSGLFSTPEVAKASTDTLIQAVRQGNPQAALFCNSENSTWLIHSDQQTAIGGEEGYFHRLPEGPLLFNGQPVNVQFHLTTHIGKNWGHQDLERYVQVYEPNYLPRYIKRVSDLGGVVSVDAAITADGRIPAAQLAVLQGIKRHVKDGVALPTAPNLALGKLAQLKSNAAGHPTLAPGGRGSDAWGHIFDFFGFFATNGLKNYFFAAPQADTIAWNLMVDLEAQQAFNQVLVTFPDGRYATRFAIDASVDGNTWTLQAEGTAAAGGTHAVNFATTEARYMRVRAITPDGPEQAGGQMAITEVEVYQR